MIWPPTKPLARSATRTNRLPILLCIAVAACGGSDTAGPPTPTQTTVARVEISPAVPLSLASGASASLTARALTSSGQVVNAQAITWTSSDPNVASAVGGLVTAKIVGTASISAQAAGVTATGLTVTVTPGTASQLGVKVQPAGAASQAALTTQPVIEIRDAAGNLVPTGAGAVTAALASGGGTLSGTLITPAVNGVAAFSSLAIGGLVGDRTLTFSAAGLTSVTSAPLLLAAGAARALVVRTQPVAGTAYAIFKTPAAIEVRDADGNVAPLAQPITASIASGGGILGGTASITAQNGVATFNDLTIAGTAGPRTLAFSTTGLASVTTTAFDVAAAPPAVLTLTPTAVALTALTDRTTTPTLVQVTNTGVFPLTNLRVTSTTYGASQPTGWLTTTLSATAAPASLSLTAVAPSAPGTYTATVLVAGDGTAASAVPLTVTLTVQQALVNTFGTSTTRTSLLNIGGTVSPGLVTTAAGVPATDSTLVFAARSPSVASVDATGRITGVGEGGSWVVATSQKALADSVYVIVTRNATGPVLYADLTKFDYRLGDTVSARVLLDVRATGSMGALTATVAWSRFSSTNLFNALAFIDFNTSASTVSPTTITDVGAGVIRVSAASAAGARGVIELGRIRFLANRTGAVWIYLNATELLGADFANLLPSTTLTQFPVVIR
ncbi:hypothetical protein BH11GEM1_BH11GEM1_04660 [soil metagenome]